MPLRLGMVPRFTSIGIAGLGLIGGSVAMLLRELYPDVYLVGMDADKEICRLASESGVFNNVISTYTDFPRDLQLVFVCTPIDFIKETVHILDQHLEGCVITDVGSVKSPFVSLSLTRNTFIPGHPMAGKETFGFASADKFMLRGATYILCPVAQDVRYSEFQGFLVEAGFNVLQMDAVQHDAVVAAASHLPYVMSCVAVASAERVHEGLKEPFAKVAAGGFRDTTRVAASAPLWGAAVCMHNRQPILDGLEAATQTLTQIKTWIQENNTAALESFFSQVKHLRDKVVPRV